MKTRYLAAGLLLTFFASACYSHDRSFPQNAKRGKMSIVTFPVVKMDDTERRLSRGAKIWNRKNHIQMPGSLGSEPYVVNYTENRDGIIDRVWILTDGEAARRLATQQNAAKP